VGKCALRGRTYELGWGCKTDISASPGVRRKGPRTFPRGGGSRPPPYGNRFAPRTEAAGISMAASVAPRSSPAKQTGPVGQV
jgi:hypothetical protein